ncbi:MAG: small conductance mechanosensitive channel [Desulforhopalus sp.]|jgi:small conductance mechanosensitive channel
METWMNALNETTAILKTLNDINFLKVGLILFGALLLITVSNRSLSSLAKKLSGRSRFYIQSSIPVLRLFVIIVALVMVITSVIEPTVENLLVLMGALSLGLGFAFKDYVSSLIAGVITLYEAAYRPGDWIEIDGAYGQVKAINMRSAEIVTPDDTVVVIPHLKIWNQLIFNANDGSPNLQCVANFYLHPRHDAAMVQQVLYDVALTSTFLQIKQKISVIVSEKPWGTHYRLKAYPIEPIQQFNFTTDLTVRGKAALIKRGLEYAALPPMP